MATRNPRNQAPAEEPEAPTQPEPETPAEDTPDAPEGESTEATEKAKRFRATDYTEQAKALIAAAGEGGIDMKDLGEKLGVPYRTISNVTWHLEGQPEPRAGSDDHGKLRTPENRVVHRGPGSRIRYFDGPGEDVPAPTKKARERLAKATRADANSAS